MWVSLPQHSRPDFEDFMISIIPNITFKRTQSQLQLDLQDHIAAVNNNDRLFVNADKTTNFYKLDVPNYR